MAMDRDIAVAFVRAWAHLLPGRRSGWEMMAATGARGLRLLAESDAFETFMLTEANPVAFRVLEENSRSYPGARPALANARRPPADEPFDYVDLDPYGSPAPFVPTALASVRVGGVLAVTATDMMVLAGAQPRACERRYGAVPVRGRLGPEGGLRILLAFVAREARRQGRSARPWLAYVLDHHVRAFVAVGGPTPEPDPVDRIDPTRWNGPAVGHSVSVGPLWLGPLFDPSLVQALRVPPEAATPGETERFLLRVAEEVAVDVPFYYESNTLASALGVASPPRLTTLLEEIRRRGYRAARTHARPEGFRTDAPRAIVEQVVRGVAAVP